MKWDPRVPSLFKKNRDHPSFHFISEYPFTSSSCSSVGSDGFFFCNLFRLDFVLPLAMSPAVEFVMWQTSNLFMVEAISRTHASLDIATSVSSVFAIVSLLGFFILEKWSAKKAALHKK